MLIISILYLLSTLILSINAASSTVRSTTFHFPNSTSTSTSSSSSASTTPACCFVVQDTVSEDWWQMTTFSTGQSVINLTSITTYITPFLNGTVTNIVTNVYLTNGTFSWPVTGGVNPISNYINGAPAPSQVKSELNGTAVVTGGVTVTSPAAFYVYNSVKIITVSAVTDTNGNAACGTTSSQPAPTNANNTVVPLTFGGINSNAEAYFGGYGAAGASLVPTATFTGTFEVADFLELFTPIVTTGAATEFSTVFLNTAGASMTLDSAPTAAIEIALTTPFIYQPERGKNGDVDKEICAQGPGKENYGYVPQQVIDYLAGNPFYSSQFPGIESCLPGGPSILPARCYIPFETIQSAVGGDLTSSTIVTVTPRGGAAAVTPTPPPQGGPNVLMTVEGVQQTQPQNGGAVASPQNNPPASNAPQNNPPASNPPQNNPPASNPPQNNPPASNPPQNNPPASNPPPQGANQPVTVLVGPGPGSQQVPSNQVAQLPSTIQNAVPSLGALINSIIGGAPNTPVEQGQVINGPTTIPVANAPQGLVGETRVIAGTPVVIVGQATTLPAQGGQGVVINGPTTIPVANAPQGLVGETSIINGSPVIIVPQATTLPPAQGTPGQGLVIPGPTTIPANEAPSELGGQTTVINGQPFIIVPSATTLPAAQGGNVIAGISPTTIPLAEAPAGAQGSTTVIDGSSFLVVSPTIPGQGFIIPGPTTVPLAGAPAGLLGSTTILDGTPFLIVPAATTLPVVPQGFVIPGATTIPAADAPVGLTGSTTIIGGTPFIIVPSATTLPIPQSQLAGVGTTLIGGTPFEIFPSATTIPLSNAPAGLTGITSTIDGTPVLVIPSGTTVPLSGAAGLRTTEFGGISFLIYPSATTIPLSNAPPGLHGSTITENGTPMLIIPSGTTIPLSASSSTTSTTSSSLTRVSSTTKTYPGRITVISGSTFEVFSGPTTVPVDSEVPLKGKTTVIGGTTEVVLTKATTAAVGEKSGAGRKKMNWTAFGFVGMALALALI